MTSTVKLSCGLLALCASAASAQNVTNATDPYLWLEEVSSPRAMAWVSGENVRSLGILEKDSRFDTFYADALKVAEATDKIPTPNLVGGEITNFWQDADHVRGIWRMTSPSSYRTSAPAWRTLIDLDALSTADKANWVWQEENCEPLTRRRCMVLLSDGGEDAVTAKEFDLVTGTFVKNGFALPTSKQVLAWENSDSLLVARDWGPGSMTNSGYPFVIKRLKRGQDLSSANEVFRGQPSDMSASPISYVDDNGRRISLLTRAPSFFETLYYLVTPNGPTPIDVPPKTDIVGFIDGRLIFRLNQPWMTGRGEKPAGAVVAVDPFGKVPPETIFVPGPRQSVDMMVVTRGHLLVSIYDNVQGRALSFAPGPNGWTATTVRLPDNAAVYIDASEPASDIAYVQVESFLLPTTVWSVNVAAGTTEQVKALPPRFIAAGLVTDQLEATSKDGTKIPYFVTHRRDAPLDGSTPALLNAYGGFQVVNAPYYSGTMGKLWLERGGTFALANIRGGGEFGPAWHEAAVKTKRQNAFDDFAAVGEDMIARKLTSPRRLGIFGGSNGGLLMGVELTQRPDLWNAVAIEIPLLDMLRFEQLSAGASWVGEYGSVSVPDERAFLERISPYANMKRGVAYPEPFIWTTSKDDRVGPVQARKFAARMKEYGLPYLYWENTEGGHAAGANLKEEARAYALEITYFTRRLMDREAPIDPPR